MISLIRTFTKKVFARPRAAVQKLIDSRTPTHRIITLQQNRIYILPSGYGIILLWVILALFLGGVNYANGIILALGYLMISFFIVAMLHTYRNVAGITLEASHAHNGFVGDTVMFDINVSRSGKRTYESIQLLWDSGARSSVSLVKKEEAVAQLLIPVDKRGLYQPGRLRIQTRYPVGLFVCWAYARFDMEAWVYPEPIKNNTLLKAPYSDGHDSVGVSGTDDFAGLRRYIAGDSPRHVDWKAYARGGELLTKTFVDSVDQDFWIDWQAFSGMEEEMSLSFMCYWVLKFSEQDRYFGLRLPNAEVELGKGEKHKVSCLLALAQA